MSRRDAVPMLAGLVLMAALAGCGSGDTPPTTPSPPPAVDVDYTRTPLEFAPDRYLIQIDGGDLTFDGASRPCSPLGVPSLGKSLNTFLWFTRDGDEWIGRSRPPHVSTLTMRVRRVSSSILGIVTEGSVDGYAADEPDPVAGKLNLIFDVEQAGRLEGTMSPAIGGGMASGRMSGILRGHFSFAGGAFEVATCTSVQFYLEPRPAGPPFD